MLVMLFPSNLADKLPVRLQECLLHPLFINNVGSWLFLRCRCFARVLVDKNPPEAFFMSSLLPKIGWYMDIGKIQVLDIFLRCGFHCLELLDFRKQAFSRILIGSLFQSFLLLLNEIIKHTVLFSVLAHHFILHLLLFIATFLPFLLPKILDGCFS